jgi:hypothetical protein
VQSRRSRIALGGTNEARSRTWLYPHLRGRGGQA